MIINLLSLPQLDVRDPLNLRKQGDTLTVNGVDYDLSVIPDGATLPNAEDATGCWYFTGSIERIDGELHLTLKFPVADDAPYEQRFPEPIYVTDDGEVQLP